MIFHRDVHARLPEARRRQIDQLMIGRKPTGLRRRDHGRDDHSVIAMESGRRQHGNRPRLGNRLLRKGKQGQDDVPIDHRSSNAAASSGRFPLQRQELVQISQVGVWQWPILHGDQMPSLLSFPGAWPKRPGWTGRPHQPSSLASAGHPCRRAFFGSGSVFRRRSAGPSYRPAGSARARGCRRWRCASPTARRRGFVSLAARAVVIQAR